MNDMETWEAVKKEVAKHKKFVLLFIADWYLPCNEVKKWFDSLEEPKQLINVDTSLEVVEKFKIIEVPTVIVFENNKIIQRVSNVELRNLPSLELLLIPK